MLPIDPTRRPELGDDDLAVRPLTRAETIPSAWYTDPRFHALDAQAVFRTTWQAVGHAAEAAEPGAHFVAERAGDPLLLVRGDDRVLRGFYNVCRHRGGPLATGPGCSRALRCGYHGWTYALDGTLRGVPHFDRVELFDRRSYGLAPVPVEEWNGLIFVHLGEPDAGPGVRFADIPTRIAPTDLTALGFARRVSYDVGCNWKVYVDNYLEAYHVPFVHPELFKLYDFPQYTTEVAGEYSVQSSPLTPEENLYSSGGGDAWYFFLFPNLMLNILPGRLQTNLVLPTGPESCRVVFDYFYADGESPRARRLIDADVAFSDEVQQEDIRICEHVQRGLRSRAYDRGRFSVDQEVAVHHFQGLLRERYGRWKAETG